MLPTKGYFSNIICPNNAKCARPYCHYRHIQDDKKDSTKEDETMAKLVKATVNQVLILNNLNTANLNIDRDKIIATVLEEIEKNRTFYNESEKCPSYSPTPLSQLAVTRRHIPVAVPPLKPTYSKSIKTFKNNNSKYSNLYGSVTNIYQNTELTRTNQSHKNQIEDSEVPKDSIFVYRSDTNFRLENLSHDSDELDNLSDNISEENKSRNQLKRNVSLLVGDIEKPKTEVRNDIIKVDEDLPESEPLGGGEECNARDMPSTILKEWNPQQDREKRKLTGDVESQKKIKLDVQEVEEFTKSPWNPTSKQGHSKDNIFNKQFPPLKKLRSTSKDQTAGHCNILHRKWERLDDLILSRRTCNTVKVNPVPNVQLYLENNGPVNYHRMSEPLEGKQVIKTIVRKSHVLNNGASGYPTVLFEPNSKIPHTLRQSSLNKIFDEFCKFVHRETARENCQKMEWEIFKRVSTIKPYKNAIAMGLLRIRKNEGRLNDHEKLEVSLSSDSVPYFTHSWSLYKCFSQYILTERERRENGYPIRLEGKSDCGYIEMTARRRKSSRPLASDPSQRLCDHCSLTYFVDSHGFPLKENDCEYHWGKLRRARVCGSLVERYSCCAGELDSEPCTTGRYHVSDLFDEDQLEGFVSTPAHPSDLAEEVAGIYGLDCEMCYTTQGVELTRCTLVDLNGHTVYDEVVLPGNPIIDYCTRFSGITEEIMRSASLRLKDIQSDLLRMISGKTILVGHSLENDLKVLRLFHKSVVDTSLVFPHSRGPPFKNSLKRLAKDLIDLTIQQGEDGHDSYEDAHACVQLMLWKIKEDSKKRKPRVILSLEPTENRRGE